jgi:CHAT domain-containing protein
MNEQMMQVVWNLLGQLLRCETVEEVKHLFGELGIREQEMLTLIDVGRKQLEVQGNAAMIGPLDRLQALVMKLIEGQSVGSQEKGADFEMFYMEGFLAALFCLIRETDGDSEQVYAFLRENVEILDETFLKALPKLFTNLTQQTDPKVTAALFSWFGSLINKFPHGNPMLNREITIVAYEQTLTVMTKDSLPTVWAETTMNLATAYTNRIKGDRAENIERAIDAYEQALTVRTKDNLPFKWALTTNNLAGAYYSRIKGDRAENIERAINAFEQALTVRKQDNLPIEWAQTTNNLAIAYSKRIKGDRAENIERAINAFEQALTVTTKDNLPIAWAETTNNLAATYTNRIRGDRAENIERAINACEQALTVMTKDNLPIEWAATTMNLAIAYSRRIKGDRSENIERAINAFEQALTVRKQDNLPIEWAEATINLATAYYSRIRGDRAESVERAINAFEQALTVMTLALPDDCRRTSDFLAALYSDLTRWTEAARTYDLALQAAEICYQRSDFLDSKSSELTTTADLPSRAAYAYAKTGELQEAIVTLEQGRARGLSESLSRDRANLDQLSRTHPNLYSEYKTITTQLRNLEIEQRNPDGFRTRQEIQMSSQTLDEQLQDAIKKIRKVPGNEDFLMPIQWEDIEKTLSADNPLVYIVTTLNGSIALIVTDNAIEVLLLNDLKEANLREILYGPSDKKELGRYLGAYQYFRNDSKANYQAWCQEIKSTTRQLWNLLMGPIVQHLKSKGFDRATLIPTGYLSLLPLHAAWTPDDSKPTGKRYAIDDIHFTYTPNARSLTEARKIADRPFTDSILAIDNPRQDLPNSQREIDCAIDSFSDRTVLRHGNATIDAVKSGLAKAAIVHFSCHGTANFTEPLNSGLLMSDGLLTLKDLLALNLAQDSGIRLAILSACETGLPGLDNIDEVVSLPIGLLQAGVAGVISSLWSVDDASTMMLLTRFYDLWRKEGLEPATALHQAQQWMHSTTDGEKADYCGFLTLTPDEYTYAHPFHWAAFSYLGI